MDAKRLTRMALMSAVTAVLAPLSIPLSTLVPVSLATLAVMLAGAILGGKDGALSTIIYLLLGVIGVPVFAGYSSGAGALFGVTGGYLLGYVPLAFFTGWLWERKRSIAGLVLGMVIGTLILYMLGTAWFVFSTRTGIGAALAACVLPFLPGDALKMVLVCILAPRIKAAVND